MMTADSDRDPSARGDLFFRDRHRIRRAGDYKAAFDAKLRKTAGPLVVFGRPTEHEEHRLGLSVGRRVGKAHGRVRIKRLLREAFRLNRAQLPTPPPQAGRAYDFVVRVRPHEPADLADYERWLRDAARRVDTEQRRRSSRTDGDDDGA